MPTYLDCIKTAKCVLLDKLKERKKQKQTNNNEHNNKSKV